MSGLRLIACFHIGGCLLELSGLGDGLVFLFILETKDWLIDNIVGQVIFLIVYLGFEVTRQRRWRHI